jgi:hypothetical protein
MRRAASRSRWARASSSCFSDDVPLVRSRICRSNSDSDWRNAARACTRCASIAWISGGRLPVSRSVS